MQPADRNPRRTLGWLRAVGASLAFVAVQASAAAAQSPSQHAGIVGVVVDDATGAPVAATITLRAGDRVRGSTASDRFAFRSLTRGEYVVRARAAGYLPATMSISLNRTGDAAVELRLTLVTFTLDPVETRRWNPDRERFEDGPAPASGEVGSPPSSAKGPAWGQPRGS